MMSRHALAGRKTDGFKRHKGNGGNKAAAPDKTAAIRAGAARAAFAKAAVRAAKTKSAKACEGAAETNEAAALWESGAMVPGALFYECPGFGVYLYVNPGYQQKDAAI